MSDNRYRLDTGCIIDQTEQGTVMTTKQVVNRLNRYERICRVKERHIEAMINALNKEIENADGDLKQALIRISNIELEF